MAETRQYITQIQDKGNVLISEDVIGTIVTHAITEVEGVAGIQSTSKKGWGKNLKITVNEDNAISIDCSIIIIYGQSVVGVGQAVQTAISAAVEAMTGIKVTDVNVTVGGIARK